MQYSAGESTDTNLRYAAYASRVRTILLSAHRYVAYTSDIGESFRPIAHPYLVKGAYGVSWAYLAGDVAHEGYKAYLRNQRILNPQAHAEKSTEAGTDNPITGAIQKIGAGITGGETSPVTPGKIPAIEDYRAVMVQRGIFQALASMGLPAFTIHSIVRYSGRALKNAKSPRIRTWGPIGLGLSAVPFLPYIFDEPVEHAVEWTFHQAFKAIGGEEAVGHRPPTGRHALQTEEAKNPREKEKEL